MARKYKMRNIVESFEEENTGKFSGRVTSWPREKLDCGHIIQPPIDWTGDGPQRTLGLSHGSSTAPTRRRCYQCGRENA